MSEFAGPHAINLMIGRSDEAADRLVRSASRLSDQRVTEPSRLPGWSRGHVLTHIARNADGMRNLLIWAKTGVPTPQYPSVEVRNADIAAGAGRAAGELTADVTASARAFTDLARQLPADAWLASVRTIRGAEMPAWAVLTHRLVEDEVHHVDLDAGYSQADWPDWFVSSELPRMADRLARDPDAPAAVLNDSGTGDRYLLRTGGSPDLEVTGPGYELLAWLLGRSDGEALARSPASPLPRVPAY